MDPHNPFSLAVWIPGALILVAILADGLLAFPRRASK